MAKVRQACVAGRFYDGNAAALKQNIAAMAAECGGGEAPGLVRALILPHAGYMFSARTALSALLTARNFSYSKVLLLAPSHRAAFRGVAVGDYDAYSTVLGDMKVDSEINGRLQNSPSPFILKLPAVHENEHSLEVQLPLIQQILTPEIKIIPLICGQVDNYTASRIAGELKEYFCRDTLWVISSDFTHYGANFNYLPFTDNIPESLRNLDMRAIARILDFAPEEFENYCHKTGATICGQNPIKILLNVLNMVSADQKIKPELISYTSSGELTGDWSHCVSYAAISFYEDQ